MNKTFKEDLSLRVEMAVFRIKMLLFNRVRTSIQCAADHGKRTVNIQIKEEEKQVSQEVRNMFKDQYDLDITEVFSGTTYFSIKW